MKIWVTRIIVVDTSEPHIEVAKVGSSAKRPRLQ